MAKASDILSIAEREVGTKETGKDRCKYNVSYYGKDTAAAWCCIFVWWVFQQADKSLFYDGKKCASCSALWTWARGKGLIVTDPQPGDIVLYNWHSPKEPNVAHHVGIYKGDGVGGKTVYAYEGNSAHAGDAADGVNLMCRSKSYVVAYIRPKYEGAAKYTEPTKQCAVGLYQVAKGHCGEDVKLLQRLLKVEADGLFGTNTDKAVRAAQKKYGLAVDGICGVNTWNAVIRGVVPK